MGSGPRTPSGKLIRKVLVVGAGPITIGQACEFDYSGVQACKALREEGVQVVLVSSNPATIMTDPTMADATYIEPLTLLCLEKIIARERPQALLSTQGGQTALNCGLELWERGVLGAYGVELIGADAATIQKAEKRELFARVVESVGLRVARHFEVSGQKEARRALKELGLPVVVRPSLTLGGLGGGVAHTQEEYFNLVRMGLEASPVGQVGVDESVLGWKEFEFEVMRDRKGNAIVVCCMENIDPMGVHTGDSVAVAPSMTLTDREYQYMRTASLNVLRAVGVETGGANVQFALNPRTGEVLVVEMNPRVSRSSALASKATGFPIAKVAAKLALGRTLDQVRNDITGVIPASFEPVLDYVVMKLPKFNFAKFGVADPALTTSMRAVGEVMAIGRSFAEALQKSLQSLEEGFSVLGGANVGMDPVHIKRALARRSPGGLLLLAKGLQLGMEVEELSAISAVDPWFVQQINMLVQEEAQLRAGRGAAIDAAAMQRLKSKGFADKSLAKLWGVSERELRERRFSLGVHPQYNRVDTCAGEFESETSYLYSTYETQSLARSTGARSDVSCSDSARGAAGDERQDPSGSGGLYSYQRAGSDGASAIMSASAERPDMREGVTGARSDASSGHAVVVLGGGANRVGQGIEFDYCCVHAARVLKELGVRSVMLNCNPETVSTDYDVADALYFEPLTVESVLECVRAECGDFCALDSSQCAGSESASASAERPDFRNVSVMAQLGGQTPLALAKGLSECGVKVLGTEVKNLELAESRAEFYALLQSLGLKQPRGLSARNWQEVRHCIKELGWPVVLRPSFVLGGKAMAVLRDDKDLEQYIHRHSSRDLGKIWVDEFIESREVDVDAVCDAKGNVLVLGVLEHIEGAGVHSGDSCCVWPPRTLSPFAIEEIYRATCLVARALKVRGFINIQCVVSSELQAQREQVYVLEANPRASRTVPFISKARGRDFVALGVRVMLGESLVNLVSAKELCAPCEFKPRVWPEGDGCYVKGVVVPWVRFGDLDLNLGPEMRATGESMGWGECFGEAYIKAQAGAWNALPGKSASRNPVSGSAVHSELQAQGGQADSARDFCALDSSLPHSRVSSMAFSKVLVLDKSTSDTADFCVRLKALGFKMLKAWELKPKELVQKIREQEVAWGVVLNFSKEYLPVRRALVEAGVGFVNTLQAAQASLESMESLRRGKKGIAVRPIQGRELMQASKIQAHKASPRVRGALAESQKRNSEAIANEQK